MLCRIELRLQLLATWTTPVVWQVFESNAIVLCITTTYLSRVVRQVSGGRTVVDYINQMLLMEAVFLLRQTSLSITQISDQLHFSEVTTFARFFNRMKGMNPRDFRKGE